MVNQGRIRSAYAGFIVAVRHFIVIGWVGFAVAAVLFLPAIQDNDSDLEGFVAPDNAAAETELRAIEIFGLPLLSRTAVVQRDPAGLPLEVQGEAIARGVAVNQGEFESDLIIGALPISNTLGLFPGSQEQGTTVITYLFQRPNAGFADQQAEAQRFAAENLRDPEDAYVGVTGSFPARATQVELVSESLLLVEIATIAAIFLIVAVTFRSLVAPLLTLATGGIATIITLRVAGFLGELLGVSIPAELEPLIFALLLGVVTDYAIFFLSGLRNQLAAGLPRRQAALDSTKEFAPIVAVAGLTVAAGTAALLVAESPLIRGFGPGMALTVLVGLVVAITLVPALMALLGRFVFWPSRPAAVPDPDQPATLRRRRADHSRLAGALTRPPVAAVVVVLTLGMLIVAALPLRNLQLGVSFIGSLPASTEVARAAEAARAGFAPGILSPTTLLLEDEGITDRRGSLAALGELIEAEPGIAGVLGPGTSPIEQELGVLLARSGDAARYVLVFDSEPLAAQAVNNLSALRDRMPALLDQAGLSQVTLGVAGDTAVAQSLVDDTTADLLRIGAAALLVNLLLLVLFLGALVAPLYLLASSVLALCSALGLTVFLFQDVLGYEGLVFYVPFAAAVLLVSLGSDYNIFAVGHVWDEAKRRPLRQAILVATTRSTRAITAAGITLAVSFGMLALLPVLPFRQLAFAMLVGILLDAVIVRSFLVPALLTLFGPTSGWPGRRLNRLLGRNRTDSRSDPAGHALSG